jgi:hypothetical protein
MSRESWNRREWRYDPETLASGWVEVLDEYDDPIVETGNVQVEFPWGNIPLQPDEDRDNGTAGNTGGGADDYGWSTTTKVISDVLNPALDNHSIATGLPPYRFPGWNGYPSYLPNDNDNLPGSFVVPDVIGLTFNEADTVLEFAGFTINTVPLDNTGGATAENDGTVKSHSPSAGNTIEEGGLVTVFVYSYDEPETTVFSWSLSENTDGFIDDDEVVIPGYATLSTAMLAATPSMANNGWDGFYLRCTNVVVGDGKEPINLTIANGDYLITGSTDIYVGGSIAFQVNASTGWLPYLEMRPYQLFISGTMAIINKG